MSIEKTTPRLHNRRTNWDDYRIIIEEAVNLSIILKGPDDRYSPDHLHWHSLRSSSTSHSNSKTTNQKDQYSV
jgi:hypothetical protein